MDIQKWLSEIVDTEAPSVPAQTSRSDFFHRAEKPRSVFDEQCAQRRSKSDSSLLVLQPHLHEAPPNEPKNSTENRADVRAGSEVSHSSRSETTESESSSRHYARKPRRKTRLERYEPKQHKQPAKYVHPSRKSESKRPRRKSKRKKGENSDSGVAQNFHAKNVSGDRLTLKPRDHLGIFNKGKTSTAIRGRGLPDLVFSEMRFLQKEKDLPESAPQHGATKKKRKKDHTHTKEGEISAFFTAVRPVLAEQDGNARPIEIRTNNNKTNAVGNCEREKSQKSSAVVPTIELLDKGPFLGFGSRGPRYESTSCVSWSDSVRAPDLISQHPKAIPADEKEKHAPPKHPNGGVVDVGDDSESKRPVPPSLTKQQRDASDERFRISSMAPSQRRISRSHSCPQDASSPRKMNLVDRAANIRSTGSVASPSSMPPFVSAGTRFEEPYPGPSASSRLTEHPAVRRLATSCATRPRQVKVMKDSDLDVEQRTSSDLGRVIQQCNYTFQEHRRAVEPPRRRQTATRVINDGERYVGTPAHEARRRPVVRFSEVEMPSPGLPNFSGPSTYEQQVYHRRDGPKIELDDDVAFLDNSYVDEQELMGEQDDMLYDEENWEAQFEEPILYEEMGMAGDKYETREYHAPNSMVRHLRSDNGVVAPGFWRPNKLY